MTSSRQVCTWRCCKSLMRALVLLLCLCKNSSSISPQNGTVTISETNGSFLEIGNEGDYKDIICNVSEQCQVSWQKDNESLTMDSRISCESSYCQALKFKSLVLEDAGYYTCLGVEGCAGEDLPQRTQLRVDKNKADTPPVITHNSQCEDRVAHPGEDVTFCCICQVGHASGSTFTYWDMPEDISVTEDDDPSALSFNSEEERASCLTLHSVNQSFEGNYTMYCSTAHGNTFTVLSLKVEFRWWIRVIIGIIIACIAVIVLTGFCRTYSIEIRLLRKDLFGKQEKNDGKLYDAYISYFWSDSESSHNPDRTYALDLKRRLTKLGYTVCLAETDFVPGNETSQEICDSLTKSRRYIILLSPQFLTYRYMSLETQQSLDSIKQYKKQIIPLFIRDISPDVIQAHVALDHIVSTHPRLKWQIFEDSRSREAPIRTLSMENGNTIELETSGAVQTTPKLKRVEVRVWKTLRLQMPPIPRHRSHDAIEEPLSSVETDSLIRNDEICRENSTKEGALEGGQALHVVV